MCMIRLVESVGLISAVALQPAGSIASIRSTLFELVYGTLMVCPSRRNGIHSIMIFQCKVSRLKLEVNSQQGDIVGGAIVQVDGD